MYLILLSQEETYKRKHFDFVFWFVHALYDFVTCPYVLYDFVTRPCAVYVFSGYTQLPRDDKETRTRVDIATMTRILCHTSI